MRRLALTAVSFAALLLAGCDMLGIDSPEKIAAAREADGKAVGAACRHAARAIEDCYALNKKSDRAAVFAGWRDMNDYMRENKIDPVPPTMGAPVARAKPADADGDASPSDKPADKASDKPSSKSAEKSADKSADKAPAKPAKTADDSAGKARES